MPILRITRRHRLEPAARRGTRSAYTLVELLMVVAILGMAAGLIVVRVDSRLPGYRLRAAAREIASTVAWARSQSIGGGRPLAVCYDLRRGEYWTRPADASGFVSGDAARDIPRRRLPDGVRFADMALGDGGRTTNDLAVVAFSPLGACEGHWLHLTDAEDNFFTVEVLPLGAQVNLYDTYQMPGEP